MAPSSSSSATTTSVQVALRIRPPTTQDSTSIPARFQRSVIQATSSTTISIESTSATVPGTSPLAAAPPASSGSAAKRQFFSFDQVHSPPTTQYELFTSTAKPLVSRFVEGFNCTILAYGQTSSGKTFTMTGVDLDADPSDPNNGMGIIPRAVSTIFSTARQLKEERGGAWNYSVKGSFIELYNEDLIDLLSFDDNTGGRREVQIREDKDGHIIWGGLREMNVRNAAEVMSLLQKGTAIRRTNETDMNAQSSRSHAIFSLTLTQKKYTGSGPPPRSSSPLPPGGRSPSRLARPGSMYTGSPSSARVASPTFGRPSTPSFVAARGRGGGGLRPASALGHAGERSVATGAEDDIGEWVTIVSKFHFVDLAGSERLKRTAAAGERIKEGISINSGLLALGNVISALGDPSRAKSHTATHVPYRDSKLTRLLQDSLGGNAHTLMIACVSPAEYNANETLNTLKYANRARNIKNRAVLNEREDGWDDVEWLQGTVTRLRKELKGIKDGGVIPGLDAPSEVLEGAGKKVLAQMTELQNNYEDLREKFVERTEELTRLRQELGEKHRGSSSGAIGGTARYEEIVGPVIEEYEKTILAMEAELKLNRAALRHTNEMVEEKEDEISAVTERHAATELYVEELRSRVAKLMEREASTEAYVRDLEEKIRAYDETSITSSESMTDLKREVSRFKDAESHSGKYIADLEVRLARSDESVMGLQRTVETLEKECERRQDEAEMLKSRLEALRQDGEGWRTDLEQREKRVKELELKMLEWEKKKIDAGDARIRLGNVVGEVASARRSLEIDTTNTPSSTNGSPSPLSVVGPNAGSLASEITQGVDITGENTQDPVLQGQLLALQQTHTATLADLSSVTAKYRDALREISDLAAQIQEAKLSSPIPESPFEKPLDTPPLRRRMTSGKIKEASEPQHNPAGRRLFFRQAASAESLHTRSLSQSLSLSQELSSAHSRKTSFSSQGTSNSHSPTNSHSHLSPAISISLPPPGNYSERSVSSLEKEIMRLQEVLKERETEITILEESLKERDEGLSVVPPGLIALENGSPIANGNLVHTALSPKTLNQFDHIRNGIEHQSRAAIQDDFDSEVTGTSEADASLERLNELMLSMAQKESTHREVVDDLNTQLTQVRRQLEDLTTLSRDQAINMSTELEVIRGKHNEAITTLEEIRSREAALQAALDDAKSSHAAEVELLQSQHQKAVDDKGVEVDKLIAKLKDEHESAMATVRDELVVSSSALEKAHRDHEEAFGKLSERHEEELRRRVQEVNDVLARTQDDHEGSIARITAEHEEILKQKDAAANVVLQRTEEEYYNALTKLRCDHAEALKKHTSELSATLERLREEHAGELRMTEIAKEGLLSESQSSQISAIRELQNEHAAAITRKEASFAEDMENLKAEHVRSLTTTVDDYTLQMDRLRLEHDTLLARFKEERRIEVDHLTLALKDAQEANDAASVRHRTELEAAIRATQEQHATVLRELELQHKEDAKKMKDVHEKALKDALVQADADRAALVQSHTEDTLSVKAKHEQEIADVNAALADVREDMKRLKEGHEMFLKDALAKADADRTALIQSHTEDALRARGQHEQEIASINATLADVQENHRSSDAARQQSEHLLTEEKERSATVFHELLTRHSEELEALRKEHDSLVLQLESQRTSQEDSDRRLGEEKDRLVQSIDELAQRHAEELDTLRKERDLVLQELDSHKVAADGYSLVREQSREAHEHDLAQKITVIKDMEQQLTNTKEERDELEAEVAKLRAELDKTRGEQSKLIQEASKRQSLVDELERHRSVLAETQESLQRVKDEKDTIQVEKTRADALVRDLQAQIARSASPPNGRPVPERNVSYTRSTALSPMKLPPPTPPPSVPPPPAPRAPGMANGDASGSTSSHGSTTINTSVSSRDSQPESPATSLSHLPVSPTTPLPVDPKVVARLEHQAKQIEEQEAMIKTLNKQLTHCETDLQTHMDLVTTLEASLGDSEKNLRKARMHATELARERDTLNAAIETLRNELTDAKREVVTVRRSIVEEKQSLEQRLDEERKAKERARQQLDSRMDELQKRKSKFACL